MSTRRTEKWLQGQYRTLRRKWFRPTFPKNVQIRWAKRLKWDGYGVSHWSPKDQTLYLLISRRAERGGIAILLGTILHEMAHAATFHEHEQHGKRWQREMLRLARIGAFKDIW